jgi:hypothetical protein
MRRLAPQWGRLAACAGASALVALSAPGPLTTLGAAPGSARGAATEAFPLTVDSIMR